MSYATVSILKKPDQFEPVNTDGLWFQFYSDSYTQSNFQYVVDVNSWGMTTSVATQSLGRFKLVPRPDDGSGVHTPHKILKSQITNSIITPITATGLNLTYGSMVKYYLNYGFQMDIGLTYSDFVYQGPTFGILFDTPHNLEQGDTIIVDKTNKKLNPSYDGSQEVTKVYTPYFISTDRSYNVSTPAGADGGSVIMLTRVNLTTNTASQYFDQIAGGNYTWNGTRQYKQKGQNFGYEYVLHGGANSFLTSYTYSVAKEKYIKPTRLDDYETIGCIINGNATASSYQVDKIQYFGFNQAGNIVETDSLTINNINYKGKFELGVGPQNIIGLFPSMTFNNVDWYRVYLSKGVNAVGHISRRIDTNCTPYPIVKIMWLNRMGSFEFWDFTKNSKETLKTNKVEWKKSLAWDYTVGDRQDSILSQKAEMSIMINTDITNEYDYRFLNELITSPEVYRIDEGNVPIPVICDDKQWVQKTQLSDGAFNFSMTITDASSFMTQDQ